MTPATGTITACNQAELERAGQSVTTPTGTISAGSIIEAHGLTKVYRVYQKQEGLFGVVRGLFRRRERDVRAVDGVSFRIEPPEEA